MAANGDDGFDGLREECGVFGAFGIEDASTLVALGLHALQHRGQEGCGVAAFDGERFHHERRMGLVGEHYSGADVAKRLPGRAAIGHVRYSTAGGSVSRNLQPLYADLQWGGFAIAHNGNLTNARTKREELVKEGRIFHTLSDTEVVLHLIAKSGRATTVERFIDALDQIDGGYAIVALTNKKLIGARDVYGIRPLILGDLNGKWILASESCALDMIGAKIVRDVRPGEVIVIDEDGLRSYSRAPEATPRTCAFEYIYFARPDSVIDGVSVYEARKNLGRILAKEHAAPADIVVPVPDSGVPAAIGYAENSDASFELGIIRSHFVGRTFIQPSQEIRDMGVRMKHRANASILKGKRVVLVDDSIVRGTTSRKIVRMIREAGATEVHFRSASPRLEWPDFYGINMPERDKLIAARLTTNEEIAEEMQADSVDYISVDGLYRAITGKPRDPKKPALTDHYFTGEYPSELVDFDRGMADKEQQLSFLDVA